MQWEEERQKVESALRARISQVERAEAEVVMQREKLELDHKQLQSEVSVFHYSDSIISESALRSDGPTSNSERI